MLHYRQFCFICRIKLSLNHFISIQSQSNNTKTILVFFSPLLVYFLVPHYSFKTETNNWMSLLLSVRYCYNTIYLSLEIRSLSFCLCFGAQQSLCEFTAVSICSGSLTSFNIELKHRNLLFIQTILITICSDHTQQQKKKKVHTHTRQSKRRKIVNKKTLTAHFNRMIWTMKESHMNRCRIPIYKRLRFYY